ncbi:hypothetical protein F4782DRAFT_454114 [Xylaria castorea]|nr:hypothetical protein F4782DRAFT_454114 [Xylaria castorea]
MTSSSERSFYFLAFSAIIAGNLNLQVRYTLSAAFGRPIHFSLQCSWGGLCAFLPFFIAMCDYLYARPVYLLLHAADNDNANTYSRAPAFRFAALALLWGYAVADLSLLTERTAGVICPTWWYIERFIPLAQLSAVFLDAVIISQVTRLHQANHDQASDSVPYSISPGPARSSACLLTGDVHPPWAVTVSTHWWPFC